MPDEPSNWRPFVKGHPFRDEQGNNPFADNDSDQPIDADVEPATEQNDPYAARGTAAGEPDAYRPDDFETTGTPRGRLILTMGALGLLGSFVGSLSGILVYSEMMAAAMCFTCSVLPPFCLSLTLSAWLMGRSDLLAMSVGALPATQRKRTQAGAIFGLLGTLIAVVYIALAIMQIYVWQWMG